MGPSSVKTQNGCVSKTIISATNLSIFCFDRGLVERSGEFIIDCVGIDDELEHWEFKTTISLCRFSIPLAEEYCLFFLFYLLCIFYIQLIFDLYHSSWNISNI
jgi:hypothetical protein